MYIWGILFVGHIGKVCKGSNNSRNNDLGSLKILPVLKMFVVEELFKMLQGWIFEILSGDSSEVVSTALVFRVEAGIGAKGGDVRLGRLRH